MRFVVAIFLLASAAIGAGLPVGSPDPRQPQPVERPGFIYYFDDPVQVDIADSILTRARSRMTVLLGADLSYQPKVYLLDDLDYFKRVIRGRFPDWGAAAAVPSRQLIAIKSPRSFKIGRTLAELFAHEYAHLALADRLGYHSAPRWLDEGLAMFVSAEWAWSDNLAMGRAAVFGHFFRLDAIEKVNRFTESQAHVAYAQSYLAVKYIHDEYGPTAISLLVNGLADGRTLDQALVDATGSDTRGFEQEYKLFLREHYNIETLFMDTMLFWVGLAIILVVGGTLRYRKRRKYYRKWEQEERLASTDFDYGDPDNPEQTEDDEPWRS